MNPSAASQLQHLMQDLQKRQQGLGEQLQAFEALQAEIVTLKQKAPNDTQSRLRLERLSRAMQGELAPLNQKLSQCMESLQGNFKSLEESLKPTGVGETKKSATPRKVSPLLGRRFI